MFPRVGSGLPHLCTLPLAPLLFPSYPSLDAPVHLPPVWGAESCSQERHLTGVPLAIYASRDLLSFHHAERALSHAVMRPGAGPGGGGRGGPGGGEPGREGQSLSRALGVRPRQDRVAERGAGAATPGEGSRAGFMGGAALRWAEGEKQESGGPRAPIWPTPCFCYDFSFILRFVGAR